jgi:predicted RNase H-like nuclease (RuvC/YqgF family)
VNKKLILMAAGAGLVSFTGAFATGWLTRPAAVKGASAPAAAEQAVAPTPISPTVPALAATAAEDSAGTRAMTEQQLNGLIYEVREKIQEYNRKLQDLEKEKARLQIAQQTLQKDIEKLNTLHTDLAASVANLKTERDMLLKSRVEVEQVEKTNLMAIAAAYDKMDPVRAGEILTNMAQGPTPNGTLAKNTNADDAVKILHFMQDRTKAKVLAELATSQPALAAALSLKLKQVTEVK